MKWISFCLLVLLMGCSSSKFSTYSDLVSFKKKATEFKSVFSPLSFEKSPAQMSANISQSFSKADKKLAEIIAIPGKERTFQNTIADLDRYLNEAGNAYSRHYLISSVSSNKALREEASKSIEKGQKWFAKIYFNRDLYKAIKEYADKKEKLATDESRLLSDYMRAFKRNGIHLSTRIQTNLQKLKIRMGEVSNKFRKNLNDYNKKIVFTPKELEGAPESALSGLKKNKDGNYEMNPKIYAEYSVISSHAKNENVRKKAYLAKTSVAKKTNPELLKQLVTMRGQVAKMLGYKHFADYQIEEKMAKKSKTAIGFLQNLSTGINKKFKEEIEVLRKLKVEETNDSKAQIQVWDIGYYENKLRKEKFNLDMEKLRVYFPLNNVLKGMYSVFEEIFDINISIMDAPEKWVGDLQLLGISDKTSGEPLGLLYMDMFPRENKYNHFAHFGVLDGYIGKDGKNHRPTGVLVCNFPKPVDGKPSLLKYSHVETLFHEFGHGLHHALSKVKFSSQHGTSVPGDFVEAPSQMLEFWIKDKTLLDRFAYDYRDSSKKIPADFLEKYKAAEKATKARMIRGQISYGMIDLILHTKFSGKSNFNIVKESNKVTKDYYLTPPAQSAFIGSFGHLAGGYSAGYYGYLWSLAIASDLATEFKKSPLKFMDPKVGKKLREEIYSKGDKRDITESIKSFLGRDWSMNAFLSELGLK